jgi:chemotaxis protein CheY-P-specific phosphatase CheC
MLDAKELQTAKDIVQQGLQHAAEALSFFIKQPMSVVQMDVSDLNLSSQAPIPVSKGEEGHLLTTDLVGEVEGFCCLIFSKEEAHLLQNSALPPEVLNDEAMAAPMREAILLEVDNIIAAAVITQFSNLLKRKMHGDVPKLRCLNEAELHEFVQERIDEGIHVLTFKAELKADDASFSPAFLWFMKEPFIRDIKQLSSQT